MIDWNKVPGEVTVVVSDLHANKRAVKAAFDVVHNKRADRVIILGDILTYGIDVNEVTDMVDEILSKGAELIVGNHDQMYKELIAGYCPIFSKLRDDLQESITYNLNKLDTKRFTNWSWKDSIICDDVYFSHANPYGNAWEYIKDIHDFQNAARTVKRKGYLAGVFGHTHRDKCFSLKTGDLTHIDGLTDDTFVINPGSVGQPRGGPMQASILRLSSHKNKLWAEVESIPYDVQGHLNDLRSSSLSDATKAVLLSFFKE